ncbi:DUF726-domain-containing protein [Xylaria sp. CBS 124048]|nr:DUF726-domain-containing protein [Xylaria sp. CBS 124048]
MPRYLPPNRPFVFKRPEVDLSAMLNTEQARQLQILTMAIMDDIQAQIRDNFDKMTIPQVPCTEGISAPKAPNPTLTIPKTPEQAMADSDRTDAELAIASLTELRRDALGHFGKWRGLVFKRMQEIIIRNGGTGGNVARQGPQQALAVPLKNAEASNMQHIQTYPPMYTALCNLPKEKRGLILHVMLLMLLGMDQYPTYSRIALIKLATAMEVPTYVLLQDEYRVSLALAQIIKGISAEEVAQKRAEECKSAKRWRGNGSFNPAASSPSNVLAEPLVAVGIGTVFGGIGLSPAVTATLLAGVGSADSTVPVGTLFGLYGARQGGKTMDAYAKDIQDLALIAMHTSLETELLDPKDVSAEDRRLRVTIGIGGWTTEDGDFKNPWKIFGKLNEVYALRWEVEALSKVGVALQTVVKSLGWSLSKKDVAGQNVFASLETCHWPDTLIKASKVMDNPWTVAMVRAEKTGLVLAEILANKVQGERAISLIGYGLGARVIYACLTSLSEKRAFGIVENVVLFGAPCPSEVRVWTAMKSIVTGRLVNVYSRNDYLLGFLYRTCAWNFGIAGLQRIQGVPRVENVDLSDTIDNHLQYEDHIHKVLQHLRWEDIRHIEPTQDQSKLSVGVSAMHNVVPGQVNKATASFGGRNGNVTKDRVFTKQQNGKTEPKDKFMSKQPNGKGKSMPNPAAPTRAEQDNAKSRYRPGRHENLRPM